MGNGPPQIQQGGRQSINTGNNYQGHGPGRQGGYHGPGYNQHPGYQGAPGPQYWGQNPYYLGPSYYGPPQQVFPPAREGELNVSLAAELIRQVLRPGPSRT